MSAAFRLPLDVFYEREARHPHQRFLVQPFAESLDTFLTDLRRARPTAMFGVPRIWTKFQMGVYSGPAFKPGKTAGGGQRRSRKA